MPAGSAATSWPIAIPLAKDRWRLVALVALRAGVGAIGAWTGLVTPGWIGILVLAGSVVLLLYAAFLLAWLASVRVEVWPRRIEVAWLLRRHRFRLANGQIGALRVPERGHGRILAPFNTLGLQLGPSRVGRRERLTVIHLAHRAALFAIPTVEGRLAIAPASTHALVMALLEATRT